MRSPPRTALVATIALLGSLVCSCRTAQELDGFHAAYAMHFDGIPDRTGVCAIFKNRSEHALAWIGLRMKAYDDTGEVSAQWRSRWVYQGRVEPGESVALELVDPPFATRVELHVGATGTGRPRRGSRPVVRVESCSELGLSARLRGLSSERTAGGRQVVRAAQPGDSNLVADEN